MLDNDIAIKACFWFLFGEWHRTILSQNSKLDLHTIKTFVYIYSIGDSLND